MPWQFFLTLSIGGEVLGRIIQRIAMKEEDSDPIAYAIVFQLLTGILIGLYAFLTGFKIPPLLPILPNLLIMPILYGLATICIFLSLKKTEASTFTILFTSRTIWVILGALLFLNEQFHIQQSFGVFLILGSIVLTSWNRQKLSFQKGELYAVLAAFLFGIAIVNDSFIVRVFDIPSYLMFGFLAPALFIWVVNLKKTKEVFSILKGKQLRSVIMLSFFYGIAAITYFTAYKMGNNAAEIGAIFPISSILTVVAAIIFLNERKGIFLKVIAVAISFIGVLFVGGVL